MFDRELVHSLLVQVREWLVKIKKRSEGLTTADDFIASDEGEETFDSICMLFIAVGENLKRVDQMTNGQLFDKVPGSRLDRGNGFSGCDCSSILSDRSRGSICDYSGQSGNALGVD